ncbi:MAG: NirD/YgiW/YdeI family stress tolerance protein [Prolixibacteraceae bacterium]|jgi:uncharacterized protein (TIGR00156 family)|nr:NirD/YgiW/YdeI family stress tolerance protein [Prolixibacteraceae bacterium]NLS99623.1 NirD/YgiW/YdeI family stress tolerance protein [Bacteroidales bacterium]HNU77045.1 NirD/YgiW/YdeI family stress tolerance protein [Prolixibacteraceae bacterium]HNZ69013.1 NirD/YgiW/YdeI family stress tolerance protein [Prolixibacteraceae bacterium]HOC86691.1 NirD/YgiW/YdeI family stress tolerance protein [Prolixibacteraceae bacterium]
MKILVVEDHPALLSAIVEALEAEKFLCERAADFGTAEEKIHLYRYDLIIVDINLPGGSGLEIIREVKRLGGETGIIVVSALLLMIPGISRGQYTGPGSTGKVYTVKEILENAAKLDKSDEVVTLKGYIVKQHNSDTYHFKDSTGEIRVEIEKKNLPATPFNEKTELLITGEVDFDLLEGTEVEADKVELVKKTE